MCSMLKSSSTPLQVDLRNQLTDRNILGLTARKAANLSESRLLFGTEGMSVFPGLKEAVMSAAKFITAGKSCNQVKVPIEFIPDGARISGRRDALRNSESQDAVVKGRLHRYIELVQSSIQITSFKQQAQSLVGGTHPMDLELWPDFR